MAIRMASHSDIGAYTLKSIRHVPRSEAERPQSGHRRATQPWTYRMKRIIGIVLVALAMLPCKTKAQQNDTDQASGAVSFKYYKKLLNYDPETTSFREGLCAGEIYA